MVTIPDIRQYAQSKCVTRDGRTACLRMPQRTPYEALTARREAANLLLQVIGKSCAQKMSNDSKICKKSH